jgi:hypothetical protein
MRRTARRATAPVLAALLRCAVGEPAITAALKDALGRSRSQNHANTAAALARCP